MQKKSCAQVSLSSEIEWRVYGVNNFQAHTRELAHGKLAPLALQLYFSYLTEGLSRLLNDTVHKKNFVGRFPQREKFCASMPICSGVRDNSLESFSGLEAALKT
jgi:hypothetical protein